MGRGSSRPAVSGKTLGAKGLVGHQTGEARMLRSARIARRSLVYSSMALNRGTARSGVV